MTKTKPPASPAWVLPGPSCLSRGEGRGAEDQRRRAGAGSPTPHSWHSSAGSPPSLMGPGTSPVSLDGDHPCPASAESPLHVPASQGPPPPGLALGLPHWGPSHSHHRREPAPLSQTWGWGPRQRSPSPRPCALCRHLVLCRGAVQGGWGAAGRWHSCDWRMGALTASERGRKRAPSPAGRARGL